MKIADIKPFLNVKEEDFLDHLRSLENKGLPMAESAGPGETGQGNPEGD